MVFVCKVCGERLPGVLESPKPRVCRTCYDRADDAPARRAEEEKHGDGSDDPSLARSRL
jgi:hypothetical protein